MNEGKYPGFYREQKMEDIHIVDYTLQSLAEQTSLDFVSTNNDNDIKEEKKELMDNLILNFLKKCLLFYDLFVPNNRENHKSDLLSNFFSELWKSEYDDDEEEEEEENEGEAEEEQEKKKKETKRKLIHHISNFFGLQSESLDLSNLTEQRKNWIDRYFHFYNHILKQDIIRYILHEENKLEKEEQEEFEEQEDFMNVRYVMSPIHLISSLRSPYEQTQTLLTHSLPRLFQDLYLQCKDRKFCDSCDCSKIRKPFFDLISGDLVYRGKVEIEPNCETCTKVNAIRKERDERLKKKPAFGVNTDHQYDHNNLEDLDEYLKDEEYFLQEQKKKYFESISRRPKYAFDVTREKGAGLFINLKRSNLMGVFSRNERILLNPSPYRDRYHQQDIGLRRGKPLFLNREYLVDHFVPIFVLNSFDQNTRLLEKAKRLGGRVIAGLF